MSSTASLLCSVAGDVFNLLLGDLLREHERARVELLYETKAFSMWSPNYIAQLARLMRAKTLRRDESLYSQGDRVAAVLILVEGEVLVLRRPDSGLQPRSASHGRFQS